MGYYYWNVSFQPHFLLFNQFLRKELAPKITSPFPSKLCHHLEWNCQFSLTRCHYQEINVSYRNWCSIGKKYHFPKITLCLSNSISPSLFTYRFSIYLSFSIFLSITLKLPSLVQFPNITTLCIVSRHLRSRHGIITFNRFLNQVVLPLEWLPTKTWNIPTILFFNL